MPQHRRGSTPSHGAYNYYYQPQSPPPPRAASLRHTNLINPPPRSRRSNFGAERSSTPVVRAPQYYIYNPPQRKQQRQGGVIPTTSGTSTPSGWETDPEDVDGNTTNNYYSGQTSTTTTAQPQHSTSAFRPPRRSFAQYIWQYAQRLRKKGKRVRFAPRPTEIPAEPRQSKRSGRQTPPSQASLLRAEFGSSGSSGSGDRRSDSSSMGSSTSKPISARASSRARRHVQSAAVTASVSSATRGYGAGFGDASGRTYTYTYTYPQYPSAYQATPESAYYLGTESIPALASLGRRSPKERPGSKKPRSRHDSTGRGRTSSPPQYHYGYYYQAGDSAPPVYRHQHRGTTATGGTNGGRYVLGRDGAYYWHPETVGSAWDGAVASGSASKSSKRNRAPSAGAHAHGREKKLRRAKGVEDIRGRSLRGGAPTYGGGWVSVGA